MERRLRKIGKIEGLPEGAPLEYDHGQYLHQVPEGDFESGGAIGTVGIAHKLNEVLDEVGESSRISVIPL